MTSLSSQPAPASAHRPIDDATALLQVRDLAVSFAGRDGKRVQAVDGVRLTIYPRQTLAVVGESGCGKSVTAMSMLHLIPRPPGHFDGGQVLFHDGRSQRDLLTLAPREIRAIRGRDIAMIFQEPMTSLNPVMTIGDQIEETVQLHQRVDRREAKRIAIESLNDVGIEDAASRLGAYPHQFSGGMRQRVMIAMALCCQPRLLLADEPTTALDVTVQAQILALLRELQRKRGMGMMLITHALGVVAQNADVVCVMYAGRVVEYASVHELFARPLHPYTRALLACIPRPATAGQTLATVREITSEHEQFTRLPGARDGVRPWWPGHTPPADLVPTKERAGDYFLQEVSPDHWVGVWRTRAVESHESRPPDLAYRVDG